MQTPRPSLVVSIHDVSPLTQKAVQGMLDDLAAAGVKRTSLLVIANHHHRAPVLEFPAFCQWLRGLQDSGHELVMHGYFHLRPPKGGWATSLVTEQYTSGEGEFFDLTEEEAAARIARARREFTRANLRPMLGFIAPAWLLGDAAERAVRHAGFEYTTRLRNIKEFFSMLETPSQSLVWSVRSPWRRKVSLFWNAHLARRLQKNQVMRVGLHPPDWQYPPIREQAMQLIGEALAGREAIPYEEWLRRPRPVT